MQATIQYIKKELAGYYPETEIQGFIRLIMKRVCGWNYTEIWLRKNEQLNKESVREINTIVERLKKYEPIQYIIGETEFSGLKIKVTPDVLIPRPETEELVQWVLDSEITEAPDILDIGTGSGCIALALKSQKKEAEISALDISPDALKIAGENARLNKLDVTFIQADILNFEAMKWKKYDVIICNPPYIRESEKTGMQANVLHFEPQNALFVPDNNPLLFYRKVMKFAQHYLKPNGRLFFEMNENFGSGVKHLAEDYGLVQVEIKEDIHGKQRMLCCNWPG
ncbi:MAG: peptide chain release factor N(5)-glutamine methyltransferase [Prolixibacteraceae bacterium]